MSISSVDAAHLLRRSGFGVDAVELADLTQSADRAAAVERVLSLSDLPADDAPAVSDDNFFADWMNLTSWWVERMRTSPVGIVEKMTLFWHDHFVSSMDKTLSIELALRQHRLFRQYGLGDFEALTQAVAVDPSMLIYLDNWLNFSWGAQENFARELMELFTLGVGNYDEGDVAELARAWTGHSLDSTYREYQFYEWAHDAGPKSLFELPARNWNGPEAITEILRGSKAEASSRFITAKVFSLLAYPVTPADDPVGDLAALFRSSGLDVMSLVRAIFNSDEFWSQRARHAIVRSPIEWIVAGLKALDIPASKGVTPFDLLVMAQAPFLHPHVAGWVDNAGWISTGASWSRSEWLSRLRWVSIYGANVFSELVSASPSEVAAAGFERFGIVDPSPHSRTVIEDWAAACHADGDSSAIPLNLPMLVMLSPEFQVS